MADITASPYERLPPELRDEVVLRIHDVCTLAAMRAASTLLRDDVDRVHTHFSSIRGHDLVLGLASACQQMAAPRTIEAIIRSLAPSATVLDQPDVAVLSEWTLPAQFFDYLAKTTPSGAMRCISLLELQLDSHPDSPLASAVSLRWISGAAYECLRRGDLDLALRIAKLAVRTGDIGIIVPVCAAMFLAAAQIEGGAEWLIKFILACEDGDKIVATMLEGGHFDEHILLLPILEAARPMIDSAQPHAIKTWRASVLCEYYLHWFARLVVAVDMAFSAPAQRGEWSRRLIWLHQRAVMLYYPNLLVVGAASLGRVFEIFTAVIRGEAGSIFDTVHDLHSPPSTWTGSAVPQTEHKRGGPAHLFC